jgi:pyruvate dehydrogenase E2 component (dihydrolipoamide acetyltransferase)
MEFDVIMPKLGLTMEEGTLVRWFKKAGEAVKAGEVIFEVETDKSIQEVESPASGTLSAILVGEGDCVPVATRVARITSGQVGHPAASSLATQDASYEVTAGPAASKGIAQLPMINLETSGKGGNVVDHKNARRFVSWRARKAIRDIGLDLEEIGTGSGPGGRIIESDVIRAVDRLAESQNEEWIDLTHVQRIVAERMAASFSKVPHFYLTVEVNAEHLLKLRDELLPEVQTAFGIRLSISDMLVKIAAAALEAHPLANASWVDGKLRLNGAIHVGLATATPSGLVVPVIRHANLRSTAEIAQIRSQLTSKAQQGKLEPDEMSGGSFTLTNLGMYGIDQFQAIINPPQSVILAVGRIKERPVGEDGKVVLKPVFFLSLSCDHRVLDGAVGAAFLQEVVGLVEKPTAAHLK